MTHGIAKEVRLPGRKERKYLCPIRHGGWLLCDHYVEAVCPECGSRVGEPCSANRGGHVTLTWGQAQTALALVDDRSVTDFNLGRLRERLTQSKFYQTRVHEARKERWRSLGLARVGSPKDAPIMAVRTLEARLQGVVEALEKVKEKLQ